MPGVCDKAQSKFGRVSKTFVMGSEAFQNSYCASREASLCFEPSLSIKEVYLKPPLEKPCDSTNFLFPGSLRIHSDNLIRCPPVKMGLHLCFFHGTTSA